MKRVAFWLVFGVLGLVGLYFVATAAQVFAAAGRSTSKPADAIVVLGASQYDGRPSPVLQSRLDHAFSIWQQGLADTIVVTGGNRPGDRFTEGGVSSRYLRDLGVPASALIKMRIPRVQATLRAALDPTPWPAPMWRVRPRRVFRSP